MVKVVVYSSDWCSFCVRAKKLLEKKGIAFEEIRVDGKPELRAKMAEKAKRTSVPQIWIDELHVGGCDELYALERTGQLDSLLAG